MKACSVNLVPAACLATRTRALRSSAWIGVAGVAVAAGCALFFVRRAAERDAQCATEELAYVQARQADVQRQLSVLLKRRNELLDRGRELADLHFREPTADLLAQVTRELPAGLVLKDIRGQTSRVTPPPPAPPAEPSAAQKSGKGGKAASRPALPPPQPTVTTRTLSVSGYAVDHARITELVETLKRSGRWAQVEFARAASEAFAGSSAIAFRVECRQEETQ